MNQREDSKCLPTLKAMEQSVGQIESAGTGEISRHSGCVGSRRHKVSVRAVERNVAEAPFPIPVTSEVKVGLPDGKTASPDNSICALTFYRKRPEVEHILRDCIPLIDCICPYIAVRGSKNSRQVGNQAQVKYHHYSQIPAKCIPSSNRAIDNANRLLPVDV